MADPSEVTANGTDIKDEPNTQTQPTNLEDVDANIDNDLNPPRDSTTTSGTMNADGALAAGEDSQAALPPLETRIPAKKDASLREFLSQMDEYAPIVRPFISLTSPAPEPPLHPSALCTILIVARSQTQ